ncbi:Zn(II)2Cys6 transcription factor [Aspergillus stella-maris]|uniref:Zn(II)2Cys6 transcription factor n=1 Tax=Aspergillus stella-maris TaxID=1810926 RepID=UPI003CCD2F93
MKKRSKPRRSHTLGSCRTCRRRHVRCDAKRPSCETCSTLGLQCEGFTDDIEWSPGTSNKDGLVASFGIRRQLLTEEDKLSMGSALSKGLFLNSVDASLEAIDSRSDTLPRSHQSEARVGPFAVLQLSGKLQAANNAGAPAAGQLDQNTNIPPATANIQAVLEAPTPTIDDFLQWTDFLDFGNNFPSGSEFALDWSFPQFPDPFPDGSSVQHLTFNGGNIQQFPSQTVLRETSFPGQGASPGLLELAPQLLRNFEQSVIPQMTVTPLIRKSPWEVVNMSAALHTLGSLTVGEPDSISYARRAHIYSILACSATDLAAESRGGASITPATDWMKIAERYYEEAKIQMKGSLRHEIAGPGKAKLKDQLMALFGMTEFAIFSGQDIDARHYLVDAERLLRLRLLPKPTVSRKLRILINVYCWLRIMSESTYVLHEYTLSSQHQQALNAFFQAQRSRDQDTRLDDFRHIQTSEHDLNIDEPKARRLDITDIHLQDSRHSDETLGRQVYGIPETWLSLLSQTTRLANVMEVVKGETTQDSMLNSSIHCDLEERASRLETVIHSFSARPIESDYPAEQASKYRLIMETFNSALLVFFYRRVRRVHPAILRREIDKVILASSQLHATLDEKETLGLGTLWPLFVAGCEATTRDQRDCIMQLLEKAKLKSGLAPSERAKDILSEVWKRQDGHSAVNRRDRLPTWMDVCKEQHIWPMFC